MLISAQSVAKLVLEEGNLLREVLAYVGWPVVALTLGLWLAYLNINTEGKKTETMNKWVKGGLKTSAMILGVS